MLLVTALKWMRSNIEDGLFMTFNKTQSEMDIINKSRKGFTASKNIKGSWLYQKQKSAKITSVSFETYLVVSLNLIIVVYQHANLKHEISR